MGLSPTILFTALFVELISIFINFQCVNIQNSHIYRYKLVENSLKKRKMRQEKELINNYNKITTLYNRSIQNHNDLPSLEDIISNIKTKEELEQLKNIIINKIKNQDIKSSISDSKQQNKILKKEKH